MQESCPEFPHARRLNSNYPTVLTSSPCGWHSHRRCGLLAAPRLVARTHFIYALAGRWSSFDGAEVIESGGFRPRPASRGALDVDGHTHFARMRSLASSALADQLYNTVGNS